MAKLFELKTHEDEFPNKRAITTDEIIFLKDLQYRINTQDHIAQADPRYWVIRDYEKHYGKDLNDSDGWVIIDTEESGEVLVDSKNLAVDTGSCENYLDAVIRTTLEEIKDNDMLSEYFDEDCFDANLWKHDVVDCSYDVESFVNNLNDFIIAPDKFAILEYEDVATDTNAFLSHEAAQAFLESNSHHFSPDAHTYAVTAWRNPDAEKLIKILHEVDFDSLLSGNKNDINDSIKFLEQAALHIEANCLEFSDGEIEIELTDENYIVINEYASSQEASMLRQIFGPKELFSDLNDVVKKVCDKNHWYHTGF